MRVLTVQQPWAWLIIHSTKELENRAWTTSYRGRVYIHAGQKLDPQGFERAKEFDIHVPNSELWRGHVIGHVDLIDVVTDSDSPWAERGAYHWLFANPVPLANPIPRRGHQGLGHFTLGET